jgi:hypothetical protein
MRPVLAWLKDFLTEHLAAAIAAGVVGLIGAGWLYVWHHFDPVSRYTVDSANLSSRPADLAQALVQIEKDSRRYCAGGWDGRLAWIGLRKCYRISFDPTDAYKIAVCSHDELTKSVETSDQLAALSYLQRAYPKLECFRLVTADDSVDVVLGKDVTAKTIQYPNDTPQQVQFCGCSDVEIDEILHARGATLVK